MSLSLKVTIKKDTKLLKKLIKRIENINHGAEVGFFGGKAHPKNNGSHTIADVALINEFGPESPANSDSIPSRPFMRRTILDNQAYVGKMQKGAAQVLRGRVSARQLAKGLGDVFKEDMQEMIASNDFVKNAPSTIRNKGEDDPLSETGTMERNVKSRVVVGKKRKRQGKKIK